MPKHNQSNTLNLSTHKINRFKQEAKKLRKELNCQHSDALNIVAKRNGFSNWTALQKEADKFSKITPSIPKPSLSFIGSDDLKLSKSDVSNLKNERKTEIASSLKLNIAINRAYLARNAIEYSIFEPTLTGLKKSIIDATQSVRTHFKLLTFHDYFCQKQGPTYKIIKTAYFVTKSGLIKTKMSLYRPITKNGDPRMWFTGLGGFSKPEDQIAIILMDDVAYLLNLSELVLSQNISDGDSIGDFITQYCKHNNEISQELLNKLKQIAKQPLAAIGHGDTSIGMSIESALGIPPNSSKKPDYKGIELKSGRGGKNRTTLFAQVPNWSLSTCKSSAEILDKYGYSREEDFRLYCTISAKKHNSQGLIFKYDPSTDELNEYHSNGDHVATWSGDLLRIRLKEKHEETFWINATSEMIEGQEFFHLKSVIHTKSPLLNQLIPLIESSVITMDHLIKRTGGNKPKVSEKGPLFKIDKRNLELLFPTPKKYSLIETASKVTTKK
ncbi:MAG: hypothetical protein GQ582_13610 [Methyloprofundus sp.]|nr:hypothetical protein [Methyloprofundus sp.]